MGVHSDLYRYTPRSYFNQSGECSVMNNSTAVSFLMNSWTTFVIGQIHRAASIDQKPKDRSLSSLIGKRAQGILPPEGIQEC